MSCIINAKGRKSQISKQLDDAIKNDSIRESVQQEIAQYMTRPEVLEITNKAALSDNPLSEMLFDNEHKNYSLAFNSDNTPKLYFLEDVKMGSDYKPTYVLSSEKNDKPKIINYPNANIYKDGKNVHLNNDSDIVDLAEGIVPTAKDIAKQKRLKVFKSYIDNLMSKRYGTTIDSSNKLIDEVPNMITDEIMNSPLINQIVSNNFNKWLDVREYSNENKSKKRFIGLVLQSFLSGANQQYNYTGLDKIEKLFKSQFKYPIRDYNQSVVELAKPESISYSITSTPEKKSVIAFANKIANIASMDDSPLTDNNGKVVKDPLTKLPKRKHDYNFKKLSELDDTDLNLSDDALEAHSVTGLLSKGGAADFTEENYLRNKLDLESTKTQFSMTIGGQNDPYINDYYIDNNFINKEGKFLSFFFKRLFYETDSKNGGFKTTGFGTKKRTFGDSNTDVVEAVIGQIRDFGRITFEEIFSNIGAPDVARPRDPTPEEEKIYRDACLNKWRELLFSKDSGIAYQVPTDIPRDANDGNGGKNSKYYDETTNTFYVLNDKTNDYDAKKIENPETKLNDFLSRDLATIIADWSYRAEFGTRQHEMMERTLLSNEDRKSKGFEELCKKDEEVFGFFESSVKGEENKAHKSVRINVEKTLTFNADKNGFFVSVSRIEDGVTKTLELDSIPEIAKLKEINPLNYASLMKSASNPSDNLMKLLKAYSKRSSLYFNFRKLRNYVESKGGVIKTEVCVTTTNAVKDGKRIRANGSIDILVILPKLDKNGKAIPNEYNCQVMDLKTMNSNVADNSNFFEIKARYQTGYRAEKQLKHAEQMAIYGEMLKNISGNITFTGAYIIPYSMPSDSKTKLGMTNLNANATTSGDDLPIIIENGDSMVLNEEITDKSLNEYKKQLNKRINNTNLSAEERQEASDDLADVNEKIANGLSFLINTKRFIANAPDKTGTSIFSAANSYAKEVIVSNASDIKVQDVAQQLEQEINDSINNINLTPSDISKVTADNIRIAMEQQRMRLEDLLRNRGKDTTNEELKESVSELISDTEGLLDDSFVVSVFIKQAEQQLAKQEKRIKNLVDNFGNSKVDLANEDGNEQNLISFIEALDSVRLFTKMYEQLNYVQEELQSRGLGYDAAGNIAPEKKLLDKAVTHLNNINNIFNNAASTAIVRLLSSYQYDTLNDKAEAHLASTMYIYDIKAEQYKEDIKNTTDNVLKKDLQHKLDQLEADRQNVTDNFRNKNIVTEEILKDRFNLLMNDVSFFQRWLISSRNSSSPIISLFTKFISFKQNQAQNKTKEQVLEIGKALENYITSSGVESGLLSLSRIGNPSDFYKEITEIDEEWQTVEEGKPKQLSKVTRLVSPYKLFKHTYNTYDENGKVKERLTKEMTYTNILKQFRYDIGMLGKANNIVERRKLVKERDEWINKNLESEYTDDYLKLKQEADDVLKDFTYTLPDDELLKGFNQVGKAIPVLEAIAIIDEAIRNIKDEASEDNRSATFLTPEERNNIDRLKTIKKRMYSKTEETINSDGKIRFVNKSGKALMLAEALAKHRELKNELSDFSTDDARFRRLEAVAKDKYKNSPEELAKWYYNNTEDILTDEFYGHYNRLQSIRILYSFAVNDFVSNIRVDNPEYSSDDKRNIINSLLSSENQISAEDWDNSAAYAGIREKVIEAVDSFNDKNHRLSDEEYKEQYDKEFGEFAKAFMPANDSNALQEALKIHTVGGNRNYDIISLKLMNAIKALDQSDENNVREYPKPENDTERAYINKMAQLRDDVKSFADYEVNEEYKRYYQIELEKFLIKNRNVVGFSNKTQIQKIDEFERNSEWFLANHLIIEKLIPIAEMSSSNDKYQQALDKIRKNGYEVSGIGDIDNPKSFPQRMKVDPTTQKSTNTPEYYVVRIKKPTKLWTKLVYQQEASNLNISESQQFKDGQFYTDKTIIENDIRDSLVAADSSLSGDVLEALVQSELKKTFWYEKHVTTDGRIRLDSTYIKGGKYKESDTYVKRNQPTGDFGQNTIRDSVVKDGKTIQLRRNADDYTDLQGFQKPKDIEENYSDKYKRLRSNPQAFAFYNHLKEKYLNAQKSLPLGQRLGYTLPYVPKSFGERLSQDGYNMKSIKAGVKDLGESLTGAVKLDAVKGIQRDHQGIDEMNPTIPFINYLPIEDTNKDVVAILSDFLGHVNRFEALDSIMGVVRTTNKLVENREKKGGKAQKSGDTVIKNKDADKFGIDRAVQTRGESHEAALLRDVIYQQVLNRGNIPVEFRFGNWNISLSQIADSLSGFASMTQIGGGGLALINPLFGAPMMNSAMLKGIGNAMQGNAVLFLEQMSGEFFDKGAYFRANKLFGKHLKESFNDMNKNTRTTLSGQLFDYFEPMQGDFLDKLGNKVTATTAGKLWFKDIWFANQYAGEFQIASVTMIMMLESYKLIDGKFIPKDDFLIQKEKEAKRKLTIVEREKFTKEFNNNKESLYQAFELKDGKLQPKEKYAKIINLNSKAMFAVKDRMQGISKAIQGQYGSTDKTAAERHFGGRLILLYKKFLAPASRARFGRAYADQQIGAMREGFYVTFFKSFTSMTALKRLYALLKYKTIGKIMGTSDKDIEAISTMTDTEIANITRAFAESAMILLLTGVLIPLLAPGEGEDEEDLPYFQKLALYEFTKVKKELSSLMLFNPYFWNENFKTIESPTALFSVFDKFNAIIEQGFNPLETYETNTSTAEKGDYKIVNKFLKLFSNVAGTVNPEIGSLDNMIENQKRSDR